MSESRHINDNRYFIQPRDTSGLVVEVMQSSRPCTPRYAVHIRLQAGSSIRSWRWMGLVWGVSSTEVGCGYIHLPNKSIQGAIRGACCLYTVPVRMAWAPI